jgi:hypothetical protein
MLWVFGGDGRATRFEWFDPDREPEALARFDELVAETAADSFENGATRGMRETVEAGNSRDGARYEALGVDAAPDPLRIPANAATRAAERVEEAFEARDWQALRALAASDFRFDDRGRRALVDGEVETWIQSMRVAREWPGLRLERAVLATAGDRLALERIFNATDTGENEFLRIVEVDAEERLCAVIRFDSDDRRAAFREMVERHARSEAGGALPEALHELRRALAEGDLERAGAALPAD